MLRSLLSLLTIAAIFSILLASGHAQSGRTTNNNEKLSTLNVIVRNSVATNNDVNSGEAPQIDKDRLLLFDGGIQQDIEYFRADPTGARLVVMIDTSQTLRAETDQIVKVIEQLAKQLYETDQIMLVGYSNDAEVLSEFSNNANSLKDSLAKIRRQGSPKLYDALTAVVGDVFRKQLGINKRAILLISDGYDLNSRIKYEEILNTILRENIIVYAFQAPDRSFGAIRPRDAGPKPVDAIHGIVENSGGLLFNLNKPTEIVENAKVVMTELKDSWYTLAYTPKGINPLNNRRLLVTCPDDRLVVRCKKLHPSQQ